MGLNRGVNWSKDSGAKREPVKDTRPTLSDYGIDKKLSSLAHVAPIIDERSTLGPRTVPPHFDMQRPILFDRLLMRACPTARSSAIGTLSYTLRFYEAVDP